MEKNNTTLEDMALKLFSETKEDPWLIHKALKTVYEECQENKTTMTIEAVKQRINELKEDF